MYIINGITTPIAVYINQNEELFSYITVYDESAFIGMSYSHIFKRLPIFNANRLRAKIGIV